MPECTALTCEPVLDRSEDAARNHIALNAGKPKFYLIELGRICRREVQVHVVARLKERLHRLGFMCGEIIQNNMDLLVRFALANHLIEESDRLLTSVPGRSLTVHLARRDVQGGVQGEGSVTVILEAMALMSVPEISANTG